MEGKYIFCPNIKGCLSKPPLNVEHGPLIMSHFCVGVIIYVCPNLNADLLNL